MKRSVRVGLRPRLLALGVLAAALLADRAGCRPVTDVCRYLSAVACRDVPLGALGRDVT